MLKVLLRMNLGLVWELRNGKKRRDVGRRNSIMCLGVLFGEKRRDGMIHHPKTQNPWTKAAAVF